MCLRRRHKKGAEAPPFFPCADICSQSCGATIRVRTRILIQIVALHRAASLRIDLRPRPRCGRSGLGAGSTTATWARPPRSCGPECATRSARGRNPPSPRACAAFSIFRNRSPNRSFGSASSITRAHDPTWPLVPCPYRRRPAGDVPLAVTASLAVRQARVD